MVAGGVVLQYPALRSVVHAAIFLVTALTMSDGLFAQAPEMFQFQPALLVCVLPPPPPPPPAPWPVAATDSLVGVAGAPVTFSRAALLANDAGTSLTVTRVVPTSSKGGTITGTDPLTYTPPAAIAGEDIFAYEVSDPFGQSTTGLVKVNFAADTAAPTVSITNPLGGSVSGTITLTALASDNVGVVGVAFFDGLDQVAAEDLDSPWQATWNTTLAGNGPHSLTAVARDAAGNRTTSIFVSLTVSNGSPAATPPAGLVIALGFDEASGTSAFDNSGGNRNGAISGAARAVGKAGGALQFDGVDDFVTVPDSAALDLTTGMTLSAWVNPTDFNGWETIVLKERGLGAMSYALYAQDGGVARGGADAPAGVIGTGAADQAIRGTSPLALNAWTHIATTYNGATEQIYVNGALVASRPQTGAIAVGNGALRVGGNTAWADEFFAGLIDEVRVYNRALSASEIATDMNVGPLSQPPAPANSAPVANSDSVVTTTGTPVSITAAQLLANDSDADGDTVTVTSVATTTAAGGTVSGAAAGPWTYMPPPSFTGADSFNYTTGDGRGGSATGTVNVTVNPPAPPAGAPGLVAAYSFNEGTGTAATDASGNARNGTIRGAQFAIGKFGNALQFDGVDDWVTIADVTNSPLDLTAGMTLSAWVNAADFNGWETIMVKERGAGAMSYALYAQDGGVLDGGADAPSGVVRAGAADQAVRGTSAVPLNAWTHIATTYDGTTQRIYINGTLVASRAQTGAIAVGNGALRIGGNNSWAGEFFAGLIDEVRVYNRALTDTEISTDMNTPLP
jgi:hypothetical protein